MDIKDQWRQLAVDLNFEFHEGIEALITSPHLPRLVGSEMPDNTNDFQQYSTMLNHPFIRSMLSSIFVGMATGNFKGYEFFLYRSTTTSGVNKQTHFVNTALFFKKPYDLGIDVSFANFFQKLDKKLFKKRHIFLNNAQLDEILMIKGKDPATIKNLFSTPELQTQMMDMFSFSNHFKITDHGISIKEGGEIITMDYAFELMNRMVAVAEKIDVKNQLKESVEGVG